MHISGCGMGKVWGIICNMNEYEGSKQDVVTVIVNDNTSKHFIGLCFTHIKGRQLWDGSCI